MTTQTTSTPSKQLKSTCHCGAITVLVPRLPEQINECQCTICRRYAAAWGYYKTDEAKFELREGSKLSKYVWGDRDASFDFCAECGCVCYWWPMQEKRADGTPNKFGLNTRNMNPSDLLSVDRKVANSYIFQPVRDKATAHADDQAVY